MRAAGPSDEVTIRHPVYAPLDFKPAAIQQFDNVGFIFLRPEPLFDDRPPLARQPAYPNETDWTFLTTRKAGALAPVATVHAISDKQDDRP